VFVVIVVAALIAVTVGLIQVLDIINTFLTNYCGINP